MKSERNEKDTETESRRKKVFITYLQDVCSYKNILKREKLGENQFFRMNLTISHLQKSSIGGQMHSTFKLVVGMEWMTSTMGYMQNSRREFNFFMI